MRQQESKILPNWVTVKTQSDGRGTSRLVDRVRPLSFRSAPHTDSHHAHTHTHMQCDTPGSDHLRRSGEMREQALLIVCLFCCNVLKETRAWICSSRQPRRRLATAATHPLALSKICQLFLFAANINQKSTRRILDAALCRVNPRDAAWRKHALWFKQQRKGLNEAGCRHLRGESVFPSDSFGQTLLNFSKRKVSFDRVRLRRSST